MRAAWSPDGASIAFSSERDGNKELYRYVMESGGLQRLTDDPAYDGFPAWSTNGRAYYPSWAPDGSEIVFMSDREGDEALFAIPVSGGAARRVTPRVDGR